MVISHNLSAFNANRQLGMVSSRKAKATERLSSGYRINRAADDAASLTISEKMRYQIRGLNQGSDNIQDGISVCQIMDGALAETQDIMHRMTELTVKASNGTLDVQDRQAIQDEINQLISELDRTTKSTNFNEKQLLSPVDLENTPINPNGGKADIIFVIDNTGSMGSYVNNVMNNLTSFADGLSNCNIQYGVVEFGDTYTTFSKSPFMSSHSEVINRLKQIHCSGGGDYEEKALEGISDAINYPFRSDAAAKEVILITDAPYHDANKDGKSSLTDTNVAQNLQNKGVRLSVVTSSSCMNLYKSRLANGSVLNISNNFHDSLMKLAGDISEAAGEVIHKNPEDINIQMSSVVDNTLTIHTYNVTPESLGISDLICTTEEDARMGIDKVRQASAKISEIRSNIGAEQNALEHAYKNNTNAAENTQAAESRMRDMDMAAGMVEFSRENILELAGQAMLAQANQINQGVLSLLQ